MSSSIIIVTHNSSSCVSKCINSFNEDKSRIIVIDNASDDSTVKIVKEKYPRVRVIAKNNNIGFAKAVNIGVKHTNNDVLLINPDTVSPHSLIIKLKKTAYKSKEIAAVAPKILNSDGSFQPNCGNFPSIINLFLDRLPYFRKLTASSQLIRNSSYYRSTKYPDWISGTCMYIKREAIEKIGLFDEKYFMYVEDVDWCYRAKLKGYKILYAPKATITHLDEGRSTNRYPDKFYNMRKGFMTYFKKYNKMLDYKIFRQMLRLELICNSGFGERGTEWKNTLERCYKLLQ